MERPNRAMSVVCPPVDLDKVTLSVEPEIRTASPLDRPSERRGGGPLSTLPTPPGHARRAASAADSPRPLPFARSRSTVVRQISASFFQGKGRKALDAPLLFASGP